MQGILQEANQEIKAEWNSFIAVVRGFLGNHKTKNYEEFDETMVSNYIKISCISLKVHILDTQHVKFQKKDNVIKD